ncbi:MAG: TetR/AcrR family transcriptional regulator [Rhizobiales bacterium]|nr:TetR/AcrR family transcriptional regulator [Hyphomicrobiales bacterium]OJY06586.1 MAG: TetR family transcriptional regulator [Rhizobiales bacterium 63-22]
MATCAAGSAGSTDNGRTEGATRIQGLNRRLILDAALEIFSAYGFRGSTIDQIAERAGMSKPNLLYYFPNKQSIYVAALEDTLAAWMEPFEHIDPDGDPLEELRRYIAVKLKMSASRPEASRLFANEILHGAPAISDFLKGRLKKQVDEKAAVIRRWIADKRLAPVDPYHLIFSIWAVTQHYSDFSVQVSAILGERADAADFYDEAARAVSAIILNGVRPREQACAL